MALQYSARSCSHRPWLVAGPPICSAELTFLTALDAAANISKYLHCGSDALVRMPVDVQPSCERSGSLYLFVCARACVYPSKTYSKSLVGSCRSQNHSESYPTAVLRYTHTNCKHPHNCFGDTYVERYMVAVITNFEQEAVHFKAPRCNLSLPKIRNQRGDKHFDRLLVHRHVCRGRVTPLVMKRRRRTLIADQRIRCVRQLNQWLHMDAQSNPIRSGKHNV